jgi:hypothetical protein
VRCKALAQRKLVSIATHAERHLAMVARAGAVFELTHQRADARVVLLRAPRSGEPMQKLATFQAPGEPRGFAFTSDAAYFTQNKRLVRLGLDGTSAALAKDFAEGIAADADFVYGVSCGPKQGPDRLQRVRVTGGEPEQLAEIQRSPGMNGDGPACDYKFVALAAGTVYVSDWGGRRLLAVERQGGAVTTLAEKKAFPQRIELGAGELTFQASQGLYRLALPAGNPERITELASAPFARFVADASDYWVDQAEPYALEEKIYRLPRSGGAPREVRRFKALDQNETPADTGVDGIAVDDECLYIARRERSYTALLAMPKD